MRRTHRTATTTIIKRILQLAHLTLQLQNLVLQLTNAAIVTRGTATARRLIVPHLPRVSHKRCLLRCRRLRTR